MATTFRSKSANVSFNLFFDRAGVLEKLTKKESVALNRIGGKARTIVKRSMRPGGKNSITSRPGEPPRYHLKLLRDHIYYNYDPKTHSVVIGALKFSRKASRGENVPLTLEIGGRVTDAFIRVRNKSRRFRDKDGKIKKFIFVKKSFNLRPRPYLGPASINHPKILDAYREVIESTGLL